MQCSLHVICSTGHLLAKHSAVGKSRRKHKTTARGNENQPGEDRQGQASELESGIDTIMSCCSRHSCSSRSSNVILAALASIISIATSYAPEVPLALRVQDHAYPETSQSSDCHPSPSSSSAPSSFCFFKICPVRQSMVLATAVILSKTGLPQ